MMKEDKASILIENLLERVVIDENGTMSLPGVLTSNELKALQFAIVKLGGSVADFNSFISAAPLASQTENLIPVLRKNDAEHLTATERELDFSALEMPLISDMRVCLDFGTAMSKATLVLDGANEQICVLELGKPGDQEEISNVMLISSVYIDNSGLIWFGKNAVDRSLIEGGDGTRQRLDNIKRRLSEDGFDDLVGTPVFAPQGIRVTYGQMILAYLMFLTWATNRALESAGYKRNVQRRFAMPCFPSNKSRDVSHELRRMLGEAQVLADTFSTVMADGIPVTEFTKAVADLKLAKADYPFMAEDITEPLGVAGALLSWRNRVDMLVMVIDVGAGTSDLSLYRILVDPKEGLNTAQEVVQSARGITEAGNFLDRILIEFILKKAGVKSSADGAVAARSKLELNIRDYKETLFNEKFLFVTLSNDLDVEIGLDEFLSIDAVKGFGQTLRKAMSEILESVDFSFVEWILANPSRYLTVALTGGGAALPMVQDLAKGSILVRGQNVPVQPALSFPTWLQADFSELEDDFARIAVSLGGARKKLIERGNGASITAGLTSAPVLGGYYQKGA
jgi:molecular chaperone HscA